MPKQMKTNKEEWIQYQIELEKQCHGHATAISPELLHLMRGEHDNEMQPIVITYDGPRVVLEELPVKTAKKKTSKGRKKTPRRLGHS